MPGKVYGRRCGTVGGANFDGWNFKDNRFFHYYKYFRGHPNLFLDWNTETVWISHPWNLKFPKAVKNMRFRF